MFRFILLLVLLFLILKIFKVFSNVRRDSHPRENSGPKNVPFANVPDADFEDITSKDPSPIPPQTQKDS